MRNPFEPIQPALLASKVSLWPRWLGTAMLRTFASDFRRMVGEAGMATTEGAFGVIATGGLNRGLMRCMVERIPQGTWELVCHPGYDDAQLRSMPTRLWASREHELKLLLSPEVRDLLVRNQVELISYRDMLRP